MAGRRLYDEDEIRAAGRAVGEELSKDMTAEQAAELSLLVAPVRDLIYRAPTAKPTSARLAEERAA